jgi:tetratricopeptide (TPR) repeat protein
LFGGPTGLYNARMHRKLHASVLGGILGTLLAGAGLVFGQAGTSEAQGTVTDAAGNPVEGAVVRFRPQGNPSLFYEGKTNKKGKYFATGLYTPKQDDRWDIEVELAGHLPTRVVIESRTVNKVLVGKILDTPLHANSKIPEIVIRPLGHVRVDLTVAPEAEVRAAAAAPSAPGEGTAAEGAGEAAPPAQDPYDEALTLAGRGELEASLPLFEKALVDEPDDAERHEAQAKVLYKLGRQDEAAAAARRAIELAPGRLDAHKIVARVPMERGDLAGARAALETAAEQFPQDVWILEQLAYVASQGGRTEDAIAHYEAITRIDPKNASGWLALGGLYAKVGQPAKSEAAYQHVVELKPTEAYQTFYNIGVLIMNRPDRSEAETQRAIEAFRKSVEINPQYAQGFQQLGYALLGIGDQAGAREALENYLRIRPNAPDASSMRGMIETLKK